VSMLACRCQLALSVVVDQVNDVPHVYTRYTFEKFSYIGLVCVCMDLELHSDEDDSRIMPQESLPRFESQEIVG